MGCYAGQFAKYEGLTVNTAEAINSQGGKILDDSGKPAVNTDEAKQGLQNLADAYKNGNIPKEAITFQEEQGRQQFDGRPHEFDLGRSRRELFSLHPDNTLLLKLSYWKQLPPHVGL